MITWLPESMLDTRGRLALSHTPGARDRSRDADLDGFVASGVQHVFCLQEAYELGRLPIFETIDERRTAVEARGMRFVHEPIPDMAAPALATARHLVDAVLAELARGDNVLVHCWAGLGRAGTIAACVLVNRGMNAQVAVAMLRSVRPGAVQSLPQERLIRQYADALQETHRRP